VLDRLGQLADELLVQVDEPESERRYRLLEAIRQYGAEKLRAGGEEAALRERNRDWYLMLVERGVPKLRGASHGQWLVRLERELDNLRVALTWSSQQGDAEAGLRLGWALLQFSMVWMVRLTGEREGSHAGPRSFPSIRAVSGHYLAAPGLDEEGLASQRAL
jgi:predicted ATPase